MIKHSKKIFIILIMTIVFLNTPIILAQPLNGQLENLARIIYAEAKGEPYLGQVAVGAVVLNRMRSSHFPNTLEEVLYEDFAFQPIANNQFYNQPDANAYRAAQEAISGHDPTGGALYFYNPAKISASNWIWTRKVITQIGNHVFAH